MDIGLVLENLGPIRGGLWITIGISVPSFLLAFVIGTVLASMRVSPVGPLQRLAAAYVAAFRNVPLLIWFFVFFFGFPKLGFQYSPFVTAILVLGCYTGAYVAETVRSGINSVSKGQAEAARAIGLPFRQVLGLVVIPQALRTVVPPLGNLWIANLKNSSVAYTISVVDLTGASYRLGNDTAQSFSFLAAAALIYVSLVLLSGVAISGIESRVAIRR